MQAAALGQAKAAYWPTVSASVSELGDRTAYPDTDIPTTTRSDATVYGSLAWRLFDFGGRGASRRAAEALLESAVANRDAAMQKTLSAVAKRSVIENKVDDEMLARNTWASAQRKEAQGGGAQSDTLQAAAALAKVSLDKNRAMGAYEKAVAALVYALGLPPGSALTLSRDVDVRTRCEEQDLSGWLQEAQQRHPAILAARAALEASRQQVTVAPRSTSPVTTTKTLTRVRG